MDNLIDFHTHILFDTDHGVKTEQQMEELLKVYSEEGFSKVICTPHLYNPMVECKVMNIRENFDKAKTIAEKYKIDLVLGSELFLFEQTQIKTIPIAERYALIEFPVSVKPDCLELKIKKITDSGLKPVIAHIERYTWLDENSSELEMFKKNGCLIQINQSGIDNNRAFPFINKGVVDIIASDNHGDMSLPSKLKKALKQYPVILDKMSSLWNFNEGGGIFHL